MAQKFHFAILRIEVTRASRGLSAIAELLVNIGLHFPKLWSKIKRLVFIGTQCKCPLNNMSGMIAGFILTLSWSSWKVNWVLSTPTILSFYVLFDTKGHFRDVLLSRSLGLVLKKLNLSQQCKHSQQGRLHFARAVHFRQPLPADRRCGLSSTWQRRTEPRTKATCTKNLVTIAYAVPEISWRTHRHTETDMLITILRHRSCGWSKDTWHYTTE